ncbi:uncharacterized protein LACBIDRAFT_334383 [Laccaria bicolor S238N-H82]|uniref:Predicted protein n=1 Tax=Laccaria bicolor (strain S238N-H82 / ATCC MYA-4686) TaxID=486041 RepID=B0DZ16_LACBS|nr:uncharacterized protein LACBIDRAFT_334383 [Laccaria bicolor S238N-H82]EDR00115.1 predicted protein [Laccaria bicolor S238N-H82]|eukprot:XP_001889172.1 predicted protein [Laccaria bicolor S238N-H82]
MFHTPEHSSQNVWFLCYSTNFVKENHVTFFISILEILTSGKQYLIRNKASDTYIQRALHEDKSLNPKSVISIPPGVQAHLWTIEKDGEFYVLKAKGAPAFAKDHLVFVSLLKESNIDVKWRITAVPQSGRNDFLIESPNKHGGWVLPTGEPYTQSEQSTVLSPKSALDHHSL